LAFKQLYKVGTTYLLSQSSSVPGSVFYDDACIEYFLVRLFSSLSQYRVVLHAYCILGCEVNLLVTPTTPTGISSLWSSVSRQYNTYYRNRFCRDGQVLSTKLNGIEIEDERLMDHQIFIERLAVAKGVVSHAAQYRWSSFSSNGFGLSNNFLTKHTRFQNYLLNTQLPLHSYREAVEHFDPAVSCNVR